MHLMNTWMALLRLHLPRLLAKESASAWIMAGTLTCAGAGAVALTTAPSVQGQQHSLTINLHPAPTAQPSPVAPAWPCQTVTLSNGHTICTWSFWPGRHHRHWGDGWGYRSAQSFPYVEAGGATNNSTQ
jgi:hypothetical protein